MDIAGELYNKYADEISKEAVSNERYLKLKGKLQNISDEFEKLDEEIKEMISIRKPHSIWDSGSDSEYKGK